MIFKEWLRFIYGMAMGTSVPYIKPSNRFLWPTALTKIDNQFSLFLGGSCVCGVLGDAEQTILLNTNSGTAAIQLQQIVEHQFKSQRLSIFNTSVAADFFSGNQYFSSAIKFYLPTVSENELRGAWPDRPEHVELILEERTFVVGQETFVVVPVTDSSSHCDLAIFLKSRKVLFLGALFFNGIHPILRSHNGMNVGNWIRNLESLYSRFQPLKIVPAEGDLASPEELKKFIAYLKALSDPMVEFSECRKNFDWIEIPGQTSLEENFDLLRENIKSFTKF